MAENNLINETSPYLLQHANNPVQWYGWNDEALRKAKEYDAVTIGITNFSPSNLSNTVQYSLITGVSDNLFGSYSCQARISQLMILELLLFEISKLLKQNNSTVNLKISSN